MQFSIEQKHIYTVGKLNQKIRETLLHNFASVWVEGEISNFVRATSGHFYFSIKDEDSQIRCAMFRGDNRELKFELENGLLVQLQARIELYEKRGDLQLIVKHVEAAGGGKLQLEFERLKLKLYKEGLFDETLKQEIPAYPLTVGVITSETGAALKDVISVLRKRFPIVHLIVYPTLVQGDRAPEEICRALEIAERRHEVEVLLLVRGGGSIEDLWAFNDEAVARTIAASKLPVVAGIGHEIDFTIADFVCDRRAPTPSAAAEYISPDKRELVQELNVINKNLCTEMTRTLKQKLEFIKLMEAELAKSHPKHQLQNYAQQLDELGRRLMPTIKNYLCLHDRQLEHQRSLLLSNTPIKYMEMYADKLASHTKALQDNLRARLRQAEQSIAHSASKLETLGPTTTLKRGYAIVTDDSDRLVRSVKQVHIKQKINIQVGEGKMVAEVDKKTD